MEERMFEHLKLSMEEVNELVRKAQVGDTSAQNTLMSSYDDVIYAVAKQYLNQGLDITDLTEIGRKGFTRGMEHFDETKTPFFTSYVVRWIRQEIMEHISGSEGNKIEPSVQNLGYEKGDIDALLEALENSDVQNLDNALLERILLTLKEKDSSVICYYYGIGCPKMSLEEIGDKMGITRERARQIKDKVILNLKKAAR